MMDTPTKAISTSALAKQLKLPVQQLFNCLHDYGWIKRVDEHWALTAKGEYEGGEYVHSNKYGRYIVWPSRISQHPIIHGIEAHKMLNAKQIADKYHLHTAIVTRIFRELSWIERTSEGWQLTQLGEKKGGELQYFDLTSTSYCLWPEIVLQETELNTQLNYSAKVFKLAEIGESDLLVDGQLYQGLDGHQHHSSAQLAICHWLYLANFTHACHRLLPDSTDLFADFYLPAENVYIILTDISDELTLKLKRAEIIESQCLKVIELNAEHLIQLDKHLSDNLRRLGTVVY